MTTAAATIPGHVPTGGDPGATPPSQGGGNFMDMVPETYRSKPYLSGIDSMDKLFQQFDNAQSLIGRKFTGVPGENAKPEEVAAHFELLGRPKDVNGYEYKSPVEDKFKDLGLQRGDEEMKQLREAALAANMTKTQFNAFVSAMDKLAVNLTESEMQSHEKEWTDLSKEVFGDKSEDAIKVAQKLVADHLPNNEKLKEHWQGIDNKSLLLVASVLNSINEKHFSESTPPNGGGGGGGSNPAEFEKQCHEAQSKLMAMDPFAKGYEEEQKRVRGMFQTLANMQSKG